MLFYIMTCTTYLFAKQHLCSSNVDMRGYYIFLAATAKYNAQISSEIYVMKRNLDCGWNGSYVHHNYLSLSEDVHSNITFVI